MFKTMFERNKSQLEILAETLLQLIDKYEKMVRDEPKFNKIPHALAIYGIISAIHGELDLPLPQDIRDSLYANGHVEEHHEDYKRVANEALDRPPANAQTTSKLPKPEIQVVPNAPESSGSQSGLRPDVDKADIPVPRLGSEIPKVTNVPVAKKKPVAKKEKKTTAVLSPEKVTNENIDALSAQLLDNFDPEDPEVEQLPQNNVE